MIKKKNLPPLNQNDDRGRIDRNPLTAPLIKELDRLSGMAEQPHSCEEHLQISNAMCEIAKTLLEIMIRL